MPSVSYVTDFLIIGGGIIGLSLALELRKRYRKATVILIEKEHDCGLHASGRNSGVLHAGFYYTEDSLKAQFTRQGNKILQDFCQTRGLPIRQTGKLVVAKNEKDLDVFGKLLARAKNNGIELYEVTEKEAKEIEPRVRTHSRALWSPTTASVDPTSISSVFRQDAIKSGIEILTNTRYLRKENNTIVTSGGKISVGYVVNAAGLYADKIAKDFGFSRHFRILPFKGLYLYSDEKPGSLRTSVYPAPDLNVPFLGVHYTVQYDGRIKLGPSAQPVLTREQYNSLDNFKLTEVTEIIGTGVSLIFRNFQHFGRFAVSELIKRPKSYLVRSGGELVEQVNPEDYRRWGAPGIRAQLVDVNNAKLEMDFRYEGDENSFHVLNVVSPGFTCAIPFSRFLVSEIEKLASMSH